MHRKGVEFTLMRVDEDRWKWRFQIGKLSRPVILRRASWALPPTGFNRRLTVSLKNRVT